jgi:hypothetical protein
MKTLRLLAPLLLVWIAGSSPAKARDFEGRDVYLQVMTQSVPVRSGPGGSYQEIGRVGMGQVYRALDRSSDGAWYRIHLARGVSGWVLSELVWPYEIVDESALSEAGGWLDRYILGSSKLSDGSFTLAMSAGALGTDGLFALRLGFLPSNYYLLELSVAQAAGSIGNLLTYRAELLVMLGPWRSLVPFAAVGAGGATFLPRRHAQLFQSSTNPMVSAGGGLLITLRGSLILRVDVRRMMMFSPDNSWGTLSVLGGAMLVF